MFSFINRLFPPKESISENAMLFQFSVEFLPKEFFRDEFRFTKMLGEAGKKWILKNYSDEVKVYSRRYSIDSPSSGLDSKIFVEQINYDEGTLSVIIFPWASLYMHQINMPVDLTPFLVITMTYHNKNESGKYYLISNYIQDELSFREIRKDGQSFEVWCPLLFTKPDYVIEKIEILLEIHKS